MKQGISIKEIKEIVLSQPFENWYKNRKVSFNFLSEDYSVDLESFLSLYRFIEKEIEFAKKYEVSDHNTLKGVASNFENLQIQLGSILDTAKKNMNISTLNSLWNQAQRFINSLNTNQTLLPSKGKYEFLNKIHKEYPKSVEGAYEFFINAISNNVNKDRLIGRNLAYEYSIDEHSNLLGRKKIERKKLLEHIADLDKNKAEVLESFTSHLSAIDKEVNKFKKEITSTREAKEKEIASVITSASKDFSEAQKGIGSKFAELEKTYDELLRLKKPAEYWKKRSTSLKKEAWRTVYIMLSITFIMACSLYFLLWKTPEGMLLSFEKSNSAAIKWSIIYITFLSTLVFVVRGLYKLAFSSFHLARDAEEREQLTYVYLAMVNDSSIDEEDRKLVIQSLFSRADTGLLKDDSGPTMPSGIINKVISGK